MNKEKFYISVIIALLVLNLGTLAYLFMQGRERPPHMEPKDMIINRLELTPEQQDAFRKMREAHHRTMMDLQAQLGKAHHDLFATLTRQEDTAAVAGILEHINKLHSAQEEVTYNHFRQLRSILQPGQEERFNDLIDDVGERVLRDHTGPRRPRP